MKFELIKPRQSPRDLSPRDQSPRDSTQVSLDIDQISTLEELEKVIREMQVHISSNEKEEILSNLNKMKPIEEELNQF